MGSKGQVFVHKNYCPLLSNRPIFFHRNGLSYSWNYTNWRVVEGRGWCFPSGMKGGEARVELTCRWGGSGGSGNSFLGPNSRLSSSACKAQRQLFEHVLGTNFTTHEMENVVGRKKKDEVWMFESLWDVNLKFIFELFFFPFFFFLLLL